MSLTLASSKVTPFNQPTKSGVVAMPLAPLTFKSIRARAVVLKLKRPVVARIATITDWPLILIDLFTEEGIVGRSYLEPYTIKTMRYLRQSKLSDALWRQAS
jgi:hypothetical protein